MKITATRKNLPTTLQIKPQVRFGKPTVKNTRVTIDDLLMLLEAGYAIDEIPSQYPAVSLEAAKSAVRYAASLIGNEEILSIDQ